MEIGATSGGRSDALLVSEDDGSWRLDDKEFRLPQQSSTTGDDHDSGRRRFALGSLCAPSKDSDQMKQLAKSERMVVHASNVVNLMLFAAKVYASIMSRSLSVITSTLDSLLDLLSGFILWFTANAMKNPNQFRYPIGKKRMQPVGIIVFASVMATLGLQILLESGRQLASKVVGLAAAVLAVRFFWWIDPTGAIIIALYTINTWAKTVLDNVCALIG
ncbi:hypothetical protein C1H46_023520 [Malus baccata]|uniref:Cation efflux protein transmembrane domain-containing protein n=1 Tax=Malus baccata TaxID=106549 RepID=A0A540LWQ3_MALBA|nr:hypothetical protein C1H46_023520 [Malus baccata]